MRGGEKVLQSLARLYPDAPLHTLLHVPGSLSPELEARDIRTTFVQRLPAAPRAYRSYLPLFPLASRAFDLRGEADLVISSSHCVAKAARGPVHLCYCHTPMRYVWDRYDDYFGRGRASPAVRLAMAMAAPLLRAWDRRTADRVDTFAANSAYVAGRIRRYYGREARVIPPPVDAEFFTPGPAPETGYDLVVSALVPYKRLELVFDAYRGTGRHLRLVGSGPEEAVLRRQAPAEVAFLGAVDDVRLRDLYRGARAVLMPGVEDFGIVPLEAMACGRPAVVFAEGGGPESVVPGETGLVFHGGAQGLREAVEALDRVEFSVSALRTRAESFSGTAFRSRFRAFVEEAVPGRIGISPAEGAEGQGRG